MEGADARRTGRSYQTRWCPLIYEDRAGISLSLRVHHALCSAMARRKVERGTLLPGRWARFLGELNDERRERWNKGEDKETFNADAWGRRRSRPYCSCQGGHTPEGTGMAHWCSELTRAPDMVIGAVGQRMNHGSLV
ncbi:hypothetical protein VNO77_39125 [Canavalia gladiata]|uniref:Uncharacterized protein n=1 Tax=Canavalia gladiata TaxID=3824 RepID=A0AAN9KAI7_CANGL